MPRFVFAVTIAVLFISGCNNRLPAPYQTSAYAESPAFQEGYRDGCRTAEGNYTKNSDRFRNDTAYHEGWFEGRKRCNPSFHKPDA